jgi:Saccharopine dehydrogenase NADP binding domain
MGTEVWILGGTGRSGRAIAAELVSRDIAPVLVGRDAARLAEAARQTPGGPRTLVAGSMEDLATQIRQQQPAVVINTIGPFTTTAPPIVQACLQAGSDYLDLANDVAAVSALLALNGAATAAGRTIVTGAGFGVTATESVVVKLTQDEPAQDQPTPDQPTPTPGRLTPARVRVDMVPSLASEAGPVGAALAGTILEGLPGVDGGGRFQGRRYKNGRLAPARIGGDVAHLVLPDGSRVTTAGMPLGELIAAQRASGAPDVVAASSEAPSAPVIRAIMPLALALLQIAPVRAFATNRLARVQLKAHDRPREHSYGHAVIQWPDGTTREGWLQLGDAQAFTGAVPAEIARRLLAGQGRPGAHTPAALFGSSLAEACGARYLIPADAPAPA